MSLSPVPLAEQLTVPGLCPAFPSLFKILGNSAQLLRSGASFKHWDLRDRARAQTPLGSQGPRQERNGKGVAFSPTWSLMHQVHGAAALCLEPPSSPLKAGTKPGLVGGAWRRPPQKHPTSLPARLGTGCPQTSLCELSAGAAACCPVTKSCPTLCNPTDCSMPGSPVLPNLPDLAQTHVH